MADAQATQATQRRKNRTQLITILSIAVLSLGGSYGLYYLARQGEVWGTTNNGEFVTPPMTVRSLDIRDQQNQPVTEGGTWWLWVVSPGSCEEECDQALHQLRQLHALLNKDANRVRRALVQSGTPDSLQIAERYPKLNFLSGRLQELQPGVYIVDPIGNLVFRYPFADAGKPVLEDLKKLLKVSQIG
jgi:cytochrome oxidase Cu insertion factor (SCO1/SenC/PrrC family)